MRSGWPTRRRVSTCPCRRARAASEGGTRGRREVVRAPPARRPARRKWFPRGRAMSKPASRAQAMCRCPQVPADRRRLSRSSHAANGCPCPVRAPAQRPAHADRCRIAPTQRPVARPRRRGASASDAPPPRRVPRRSSGALPPSPLLAPTMRAPNRVATGRGALRSADRKQIARSGGSELARDAANRRIRARRRCRNP